MRCINYRKLERVGPIKRKKESRGEFEWLIGRLPSVTQLHLFSAVVLQIIEKPKQDNYFEYFDLKIVIK